MLAYIKAGTLKKSMPAVLNRMLYNQINKSHQPRNPREVSRYIVGSNPTPIQLARLPIYEQEMAGARFRAAQVSVMLQ